MKKILIIYLLFISVARSESTCEQLSGLARMVMQARQDGIPMTSIYGDNTQELTKEMIINAYEKPQLYGNEIISKYVTEFSNQYFLECVKKYPTLAKNNAQELHKHDENSKKALHSNWGEDIQAVLTEAACKDPEFAFDGYKFAIDSGIPVAKIKRPSDYYYISQGIAYTVQGCWKPISSPDVGIIDSKMRRKHDNKVWQSNMNLKDGTWH